jgi:hypothetical protein
MEPNLPEREVSLCLSRDRAGRWNLWYDPKWDATRVVAKQEDFSNFALLLIREAEEINLKPTKEPEDWLIKYHLREIQQALKAKAENETKA